MITTAWRWLAKRLSNALRPGRTHAKAPAESVRPGLDPLEDRLLCDVGLGLPLGELINPNLAAHVLNPGPDVILYTPVIFGRLAEHIHPYLTIRINGHPAFIPAGIGIGVEGGDMPLHTHDSSRTANRGTPGTPIPSIPNPTGAAAVIHVESLVKYPFRLRDFFAIWGQTFTPTDILGHLTDAHHKIIMTVNGVRSYAFGNLRLRANEGFQTNPQGTQLLSNPVGIEIDYVTVHPHHTPLKE